MEIEETGEWVVTKMECLRVGINLGYTGTGTDVDPVTGNVF